MKLLVRTGNPPTLNHSVRSLPRLYSSGAVVEHSGGVVPALPSQRLYSYTLLHRGYYTNLEMNSCTLKIVPTHGLPGLTSAVS